VQLHPVLTSSAAATAAQAAVAPVGTIRRFLQQHGVADVLSQDKPADAKATVTRVICVRK
jgi:hypothetical protein